MTCKLCGGAHRGWERCAKPKVAAILKPPDEQKPADEPAPWAIGIMSRKQAIEAGWSVPPIDATKPLPEPAPGIVVDELTELTYSKHGKYKDPEARKKYQREKMAAYRANKKKTNAP
jgi:hypothetical protein